MQLQWIPLIVHLVASSNASAVTLAQNGHARYAIVTKHNPSQTEDLASRELRDYLNQITNAQFVIQSDRNQDSLILTIASSGDMKPESFSIAIRGSDIVITGADGPGLLYAIYAFLEQLGCRWLAPGYSFYHGSHEFIPASRDLRFSGGDIQESPALKLRKLYVEEGHSHTAKNLQQLVEWMAKLRFNMLVVPTNYQGAGRVKWDNWREALIPELQRRGITIEVGGHGYQNFINAREQDGKLFELHPQWFGMNEAGQRTQQGNRVFCSSNQDAVAHVQRNLLAYLKGHAEIQIFDFWPPDGAAWCMCESCKQLGSPSQRHAILVAQTSEAVHRELPKIRIECIAYSSYVDPPQKVSFDPSVLVDLCPINQSFEYQIDDPGSPVNARYAHALQGWGANFKGDISIYSYYRKYGWNSLPILLPHYMQKDLQFYRSLGVRGVSSYAEPGDWFTYELNHYVLGHLAWNPDADVNALIREFCVARYGPAADLARNVFTRLEETTRRACSIPSTSLKPPADYDRFAAEIDTCLKDINQADQMASGDDKLRAQLSRLRLMVQYAEQDIALQRDAANRAATQERRGKVETLARFLSDHLDDGVFLAQSRLELEPLYKHYDVASQSELREAQRKRRLGRDAATTTQRH